ncbi:tyrosine-type recombinase/integrase [Saccharopolyspora pogona]|uniref:tyrosine-type recombinase/integrase n=1 Tax=Saccharopolyspora pogona TaxID=333966 RepID=UPI001683DD18|nr:tyrosine-type recombinase/integrase [Saccharopolyspora pogona]
MSNSEIEIIMPEPGAPQRRSPGTVEHYREPEHRWTLDQLQASWLAGHNTSKATFDEYTRDFEQYRRWCESVDLDPLTVGLPEVQMYGEYLARLTSAHGKPLAARTRTRKINAVSSFYRHAAQSGAVAYNPARDAQRPKYDRKHSPTQSINEADARRMLASVRKLPQRVMHPQAFLLVISSMIDLGARVSEVCNLDVDDIGTRRGMRVLTMRAKGNKIRVRPVTAQFAPILDDWLGLRPKVEGEPAMIVDNRGKRVTRNQIYELIKRLAKHAGIVEADRVTPHSCRHAFNEIAKARGASLESRRIALGHESEATTALYDHQGADLATDPAHLVSAATFTNHYDEDDEEQ